MKTIRRVFLAGKITGNDWRRELVRGDLAVQARWPGDCVFGDISSCAPDRIFPVQEGAVLSMLDYVGPYYVAPPDENCGCDSGEHNHGTWDGLGHYILLRANMHALRAADLVFAWLDDPTAAATLYEVGYAVALGKEVFIAGPEHLPQLGLIYHASPYSPVGGNGWDAWTAQSPHAAFVRHLAHRLAGSCDPITIDPAGLSPLEGQFLRTWNEANETALEQDVPARRDAQYLALFPQWPVDEGRYRLDFAYLDASLYTQDDYRPIRIGIEIDGLAAHGTTDQIARDRSRQRELEAMGWRLIRFGGKEVYHDVGACVAEARRIIVGAIQERTTALRGGRAVRETMPLST